MKRHSHFFITALVLILLTATALPAAEVVIIKSNDITAYNQATDGFYSKLTADIAEYNLQGRPNKAPHVIKKIKRNPPKLIFALGALAAVTAKESFPNIPIIYTMVLNAENKNLAAPNIAGIKIEVSALKQFKILKKLVPGTRKIGVLYSERTEKTILNAQKSAQLLRLELVAIKIRQQEEVPSAVKGLLKEVDSLWLIPDSIVVNKDSLHYLLLLSLENHIPFMVYNKIFVKGGALLSPAVNYTQVGRQAGKLAQQTLNGTSLPLTITPPADTEWAVNLYTAQNMGLNIPAEVLSLFKYVYK